MNQVLIDAINDGQMLCFYHEHLLREVEPYAYGLNAKGEEVLRAFQVGGQSKSGRVPCWRTFEVAKIQNIYLAGRAMSANRPDYCPEDNELIEVFARR